ncbi:MAG: hypothetical protein WC899_12125 [bacterium]|jgi:hypothetical protein
MGRIRWCAIIFVAIAALIFSEKAKAINITYKTYGNARFGYVINYPVDILIPQGEADNGDGQKFISRDKDVIVLVYGSNNALDETLKGKYQDAIRGSDSEIRKRVVKYKIIKQNMFVVSGEQGEDIFYLKTIYNNDAFITFQITYPKSRKRIFNPIVTAMSKSFKIASK